MTNLALNTDGDYEYKNRPAGDHISVRISYSKEGRGGRGRGVYAYIEPWVDSSCILGQSASTLLLTLPRQNAKALQAVAEKMDAVVAEAARLYEGIGPEATTGEDRTDACFTQQQRIRKHGDPTAAIGVLRDAMVGGVAQTAAAAGAAAFRPVI